MTMPDPVITKVALTFDSTPVGIGFATILRKPMAQNPPRIDDKIVVVADLELPAEQTGADYAENTKLHPLLQFEARVATVFDAVLNVTWSNTPKRVARQKTFTGTIWVDVMAAALLYCNNEVAKLVAALLVRETALHGA
jgi:hypothetical protein